MRYLMTGEQMKEVDRYTMESIGIPSLVLMERAAMAVAREAGKLVKKTDSIWAVCGTGNNGADAVAAARMLALEGYRVTVIIAGNRERGTKEFHTQLEIADRLGLSAVEWKDFIPGRCDLIIDGLLGVGLARDVEGEYKEILDTSGAMDQAAVVAVDIPSGIDSATGQVMGTALKADVTVTFGCQKLGTALYPGRDYCGKLVIEDIGFPEVSYEKARPFAWTFGKEDLKGLPARPAYSNKGTFGKVLVIAGSPGMSGAAYLTALAAYRMGAGLVKILTVEENRQILQQQLPEALVSVYRPKELTGGRLGERAGIEAGPGDGSEDRAGNRPGDGAGESGGSLEEEGSGAWEERIGRECAWADVIAVGPGLGREPYVELLIRSVLTSAYVPIVLDADALNTIADHPYLEQYYTENIVITPHLGEMARLTGKTIREIQRDVPKTAMEYSAGHGIVCVLKDAATVVSNREGQCYVNSSGNSCMAKAGSGDVLAGAVAGLLAQKMEPFDGAVTAVYVHGLAGDRYRKGHGSRPMLARELADNLAGAAKGRVPIGEGRANTQAFLRCREADER